MKGFSQFRLVAAIIAYTDLITCIAFVPAYLLWHVGFTMVQEDKSNEGLLQLRFETFFIIFQKVFTYNCYLACIFLVICGVQILAHFVSALQLITAIDLTHNNLSTAIKLTNLWFFTNLISTVHITGLHIAIAFIIDYKAAFLTAVLLMYRVSSIFFVYLFRYELKQTLLQNRLLAIKKLKIILM